jgi:hypothetical protein
MYSSSVPKTSWPELVARTVPAAVLKINADRPDVTIELLLVRDASTVPPGYDAERVRVFFDVYQSYVIVMNEPFVG